MCQQRVAFPFRNWNAFFPVEHMGDEVASLERMDCSTSIQPIGFRKDEDVMFQKGLGILHGPGKRAFIGISGVRHRPSAKQKLSHIPAVIA